MWYLYVIYITVDVIYRDAQAKAARCENAIGQNVDVRMLILFFFAM